MQIPVKLAQFLKPINIRGLSSLGLVAPTFYFPVILACTKADGYERSKEECSKCSYGS
jgi:hypothetical protein